MTLRFTCSLISKKESSTTYFNSKDAFKKCNFDYVIFTRKIWDSTIPTLTNAKDELISNLIEQKSIHSTDTQIIYLPAPWENFKRRAEEWEDKLQIIKTNKMEKQELKQRISDYFVEMNEDKFTKLKSIECKHNIIWKGNDLKNKFMLTKNTYSHELKMQLDYRHLAEVDSVFFKFTYSNTDDGNPDMTDIKMYLILDDDRNIVLSNSSGFACQNVRYTSTNIYIESAQLAVGMSDFIAIANAKKIEYSIRFGKGGNLASTFNENDIVIFKGFYNAAFDSDFELEAINNVFLKQAMEKDLKTKAFQNRIAENKKKSNGMGFGIAGGVIGFFLSVILFGLISAQLIEQGYDTKNNQWKMFAFAMIFLGGYIGYKVSRNIYDNRN